MTSQSDNSGAMIHGERVLLRIQWLTVGFGLASAIVAALMHQVDWAKGLFSGAVLAWLNFRWLQTGIRTLFVNALSQARATADRGGPPASGSNSATSGMIKAFALLFRYALVGLAVYVIFIYLHVPLVSIGLGLCALVAAILVASVWEVLQPED